MAQADVAVKGSGFDLKNEHVELVRDSVRSERTSVAIDDLEAMRTERFAVPASKYGLEAICGASCETGAL